MGGDFTYSILNAVCQISILSHIFINNKIVIYNYLSIDNSMVMRSSNSSRVKLSP